MHFRKPASLLVISGIIFILVLKTFIRPTWLSAPAEIKFLMGIFPNLYGSFLLPVGICMFEKEMFIFFNRSMLAFYCLSCFAALVINEYLQLIPIFMRTFDYFDIIASAVGLLAGYLFTSRILMRSMPQRFVMEFSS